jgi:hypothetical protein
MTNREPAEVTISTATATRSCRGAGHGTRSRLRPRGRTSPSVKLEGIDLVLEGEAIRATDKGTLERLAERYRAVGWPAEVDGDALTAPFSAPSTGPPPWQLYRFVPQTGFGVAAEEPYGATRWRFR